jgi:hypothetical protein
VFRFTPARAILIVAPFAVIALCLGAAMVFGDPPADEPVAAETSQPAPLAAPVTTAETSPVPTMLPRATAAATTKPPAPKKTTAKPVYYASCAAVRAAGKAPLRKGSPGYRTVLDQDKDGKACEAVEGSTGGGSTGGTDPRYGTCKEANAHGYGPYKQGRDPEYDWYQDRDHDGLVCE